MIKRIKRQVIDCRHPGANYYRHWTYIIPQLHMWLAYQQTCVGIKVNWEFKSYQLFIQLQGHIAKRLSDHYKKRLHHERLYNA